MAKTRAQRWSEEAISRLRRVLPKAMAENKKLGLGKVVEVERSMLAAVRAKTELAAKRAMAKAKALAAKIPRDPRDPLHDDVEAIDKNVAAYWRAHRGARSNPDGRKWIGKAITRPGKLGGKGFVSKPQAEQRKILRGCMRRHGYRSCLGSVMLLENVLLRDPDQRGRMKKLRMWMVAAHRKNPGEFARSNPRDGSWAAVPAIVVPFNIRTVTLTAVQLRELTAIA